MMRVKERSVSLAIILVGALIILAIVASRPPPIPVFVNATTTTSPRSPIR